MLNFNLILYDEHYQLYVCNNVFVTNKIINNIALDIIICNITKVELFLVVYIIFILF